VEKENRTSLDRSAPLLQSQAFGVSILMSANYLGVDIPQRTLLVLFGGAPPSDMVGEKSPLHMTESK